MTGLAHVSKAGWAVLAAPVGNVTFEVAAGTCEVRPVQYAEWSMAEQAYVCVSGLTV